MPEMQILSQNVLNFRHELRQSQIEFAANCGISTEALSAIERGIGNPTLKTLQSIAAYVGCSAPALITKHPEFIY